MKKYDYIIAGAGAAGLSLLYRMIISQKFSDKKILLIDKSEKIINDRTWCFWEKENDLFESCISYKWDKLYFHCPEYSELLKIQPYKYKMLESNKFYNFCFEKIKENSNIEFVQDEIIEIKDEGILLTKAEKYQADYIFNSAKYSIQKNKENYYLLQHFMGWFIKSKEECFNPNEPVLMDFRIEQNNQCRFVYVLPFNKNEALVEFTLFSENVLEQAEYESELKNYIKKYIGIEKYEITHNEFGVIPMTNNIIAKKQSEKVINIGTAGGATKASTGYTFKFIQKQTSKIVKSLIEHDKVIIKNLNPEKYHFYDSVFLRVLSEKKYPSWKIFSAMFQKLPPFVSLNFLDEESTIFEDIKIMNSVDKKTFIMAALKEIF